MTGDHVPLHSLIAYLLGETDEKESAHVSGHVAGCEACAASLSRAMSVQQTLRADRELAPGPSAAAIERVKSLVMPHHAASRPSAAIDVMRRVVAALTYDSRTVGAQAGLRGESTSYLLSFAHGHLSLDVEIEPSIDKASEHYSLIGQLSGEAVDEPDEVVIVGGRGFTSIVPCDDSGVFAVVLEPGRYDVLVDHDRELVVFSEIDVG